MPGFSGASGGAGFLESGDCQGQGRECNEDQGPEPGKSIVYYEGVYIHWLKFLCRGKQSLILKRFLVPNLLGEMGGSWATPWEV